MREHTRHDTLTIIPDPNSGCGATVSAFNEMGPPFSVYFAALVIRELREVLALADSGRLTPIPLEFWRPRSTTSTSIKHRQVAGRAVITPQPARRF
jgi:hypothetical protein